MPTANLATWPASWAITEADAMRATSAPSSRVPVGGLTRSQVARQLRTSITTVHRLRITGELRAHRDAAGVWRYELAEIARVAAKRGVPGARTPGEIAAQVFRMLDQGAGLREIVMMVKVVPEEVRRLYRDYKTSLYAEQPARRDQITAPSPPKTGDTGDTGDRGDS
jgi:hypothetical protein